jgi:uncharacterized protein YjcR
MNDMTEPMPDLAADQAPTASRPGSRQIDWERIELDFRAGFKTLREIAGEHGITHRAIQKRAQRDGWDRDIQAKIHARAKVLVAKESVATQLVAIKRVAVATERDAVAAEAQVIATVQSRRRLRLDRLNALQDAAMAMAEQAVQATAFLGDLRRLADSVTDPHERTAVLHQIETVEDAVGADAQVARIQRLANSADALGQSEAEVYGLTKDAPAGSTPSSLLHFYPDLGELPPKPQT